MLTSFQSTKMWLQCWTHGNQFFGGVQKCDYYIESMSPNYQSLSECNYIAESMPTCSENVLKWLKLGILANQACAQVPCAPKCYHMLNPSQQALRVHWNVTASMNQKQQYLMMWRKLHYTPVTHWSWVQWQSLRLYVCTDSRQVHHWWRSCYTIQ